MTFRNFHLGLSALACLSGAVPSISAQDLKAPPCLSDLPNAPDAVISSNDPPQVTNSQAAARTRSVGRFETLIDPTEIATHLTAFDKVGMGLKRSVSPWAILGWIGSATYGETFNRSPNYGQDPKEYLQRLGAAAARASSETIFTTSILAPMLHEDPRYFVLGPGHSGFKRTTFAFSQIFITRTDKGGNTVNYALLGGNLAGSALTQAYYPSENRGVPEVLTTFGTSLAGSAIAYFFDEFFYNNLRVAQLKHRLPL